MSTVNSRPYRWPYHGALRPATTAILVFSDGVESAENSPAFENLRIFVERGRAAGMHVVHSPGKGSKPVLGVQTGDLVCERPAYGGFTGSDMTLVLDGIGATDLLIAGFPMELGADCTMREANDLGFECLLLTDCCTSLSQDTAAGAISSVQMSGGIFGAVATSKDVLEALGQLVATT